jgi:hypothetical protein
MNNLVIIIVLAVAIVTMSIIAALGKAVGSGANTTDLFPEGSKANEPKTITRDSKILRTIAGLLFGVLLLCPIMYINRINGEPFINMNHQIRDYFVGFMIIFEMALFLIIWLVDRKGKPYG